MNRRNAKMRALDLVISMIDQELRSPTGLTLGSDDMDIPTPDNLQDFKKVQDELEGIMRQLEVKLERFR